MLWKKTRSLECCKKTDFGKRRKKKTRSSERCEKKIHFDKRREENLIPVYH